MKKVTTFEQARDFVKKAGFCLRYWGNDAVPIPSFYDAVLGKAKDRAKVDATPAIELVNRLLEKHEVVEVTVIADRVCLVHRSLMPALFKLVRAKSESGALPALSPEAIEVLSLLEEKGEIVTGDVRKLLGAASTKTSDDPAYVVLGELQKHLRIDRGPFKITNRAIPYLAKEGYPYHVFEEAHLELANEAAELGVEEARKAWLKAYSKAQPGVPPRKLASLFKGFLSKDEAVL
jgi:hypothetical protein